MISFGRFTPKSLTISALFLVAAAGVAVASGHDHSKCEGFVPENNVKIPVGTKMKSRFFSARQQTGGLTEADFNAVIDRAERLYAPVIKQAGGNLKVNRLWTNATVNASAQQMGTTWIVNMYGGLARHAAITTEGFALVICHEIGHHIGGAPKIEGWMGTQWATNEGGADYFATIKCLRNYFAEDDNIEILKTKTVDPIAAERCVASFPSSETDAAICMRSSLAAQSVSYLFQDLRKETTQPKFDTPDQSKVTKTNDAHPATQCRMDTYFAGLGCEVRADVPNSDTDYRAGSCVAETHAFGARPSCWFAPKASAEPTPEEPAPTPEEPTPAPEQPEPPTVY